MLLHMFAAQVKSRIGRLAAPSAARLSGSSRETLRPMSNRQTRMCLWSLKLQARHLRTPVRHKHSRRSIPDQTRSVLFLALEPCGGAGGTMPLLGISSPHTCPQVVPVCSTMTLRQPEESSSRLNELMNPPALLSPRFFWP